VAGVSGAEPRASMAKTSDKLLAMLEQLQEGRMGDVEDSFTFGSKELILYALGIRA